MNKGEETMSFKEKTLLTETIENIENNKSTQASEHLRNLLDWCYEHHTVLEDLNNKGIDIDLIDNVYIDNVYNTQKNKNKEVR